MTIGTGIGRICNYPICGQNKVCFCHVCFVQFKVNGDVFISKNYLTRIECE